MTRQVSGLGEGQPWSLILWLLSVVESRIGRFSWVQRPPKVPGALKVPQMPHLKGLRKLYKISLDLFTDI